MNIKTICAVCVAQCVAWTTTGCDDEAPAGDAETGQAEAGDGTGADGADEPNPGPLLEEAMGFRETMTQVNQEPAPSQHGLADRVNVWVNELALAPYLERTPDTMNDTAFPQGSMLVKEHLNDAGEYDGFLTMWKASEGYNAEAADWWWARVDGTGKTFETGKVGFCIGCHTAAQDSGFVFGVPADNRRP